MIKKFNIDIYKLFNKFDSSKNQQLEIDELGAMLRKIDQSLTDEDITNLFTYFDDKKVGSVNFQQFMQTLYKLSGDEMFLSQYYLPQKMEIQQPSPSQMGNQPMPSYHQNI